MLLLTFSWCWTGDVGYLGLKRHVCVGIESIFAQKLRGVLLWVPTMIMRSVMICSDFEKTVHLFGFDRD